MNDDAYAINQQLQSGVENPFVQIESATASIPIVDELIYELGVQQIELEMQNEELRQSHLALEASRESYISLYDFAPVGYLSLTIEGVIAGINLTGAKLLGVERNKLINQRFDRLVLDDGIESWYRHTLLVKQQGRKQSFELPLRRADGTGFYALLDCIYVKADNADPPLRITFTEITGRKQAESELQVSHAALRSISQGVVITDSDGLILFANEALETLTGYSEAEILGKTCQFLQGPDTNIQVQETIRQAVKNNAVFSGEILNYRKDGTPFWNDMVISPVQDNDSGRVTHYIGITRDITQRKQAEEELRIASVAFETQAGIVVADADKVILRVNKAFSQITGYSADEVIGKRPLVLRSEQHDDIFYQSLWAAVSAKGHWQGEIWKKRKNGEIFPVWQTITVVTGADGNITHYVSSYLDITTQKRAEKVLLDARERLEKQVATTQFELETIKEETGEINSALKVLIKSIDSDKYDAQTELSEEVELTILPILKKLKKASADRIESTSLIDNLETSLQHLLRFYGRKSDLRAAYQKLSPVEAQVASMVKQGLSTKLIAATLNSSPETINNHRKHIRKKLGLESKEINLFSYLNSLIE
jgi:PAS domain S-box-containing protein